MKRRTSTLKPSFYIPALLFCLIASWPVLPAAAQIPLTLDLQKTISLANDSSLEAFRAQNMYLAGYWAYRTYRANRLPSVSLNLTPAQYNRDITRRYDSSADLDVYRTQQSFYASAGLTIRQNLDLTGGTFYVNSNLNYLRNFSESGATNQYSSVPLRIGYSQSLVGYNAFRWDRKIEPLKYEKVKKEFIYNVEQVSEQAATYFFALALAQAEYDLAVENVSYTDTLYRIGEQRYKIASISRSELLTLQLDKVNAANQLQTTTTALKRAMSALASFLNVDKNTVITLMLPETPGILNISTEEAIVYGRQNNPTLLGLRQSILEAEQTVDRTKKESYFNATFDASIGFNQVSETLGGVYRSPMQQDLVSISMSIPLIDWGVRKGQYNMARNNLNIARITATQNEISIEEDILMTVNDFQMQQKLIISAQEALDLAAMVYEQVREQFIIGRVDISNLTLSMTRQQTAQQNYIAAMQQYWQNYYKIRRLTLYDFENRMPLADKFDYDGGNLTR